MKIFGYNILTNSELKKIEQDHWDRFKKYLKIKELWEINTTYVKKPKCSACDDKRRLKIIMPDGSFRTVSCSCDGSIKEYSIIPAREREIIVIRDNKAFMSDGLSDYAFENRIVFNKSELTDKKDLAVCFYVSKKLCEQALKMLRSKNNDN